MDRKPELELSTHTHPGSVERTQESGLHQPVSAFIIFKNNHIETIHLACLSLHPHTQSPPYLTDRIAWSPKPVV